MDDMMDPQAVEERSHIEQENYKVYKKRWLVLFAMSSLTLVVGLNKSLISIADILKIHIDITSKQYKVVQQMSMYTTLVSVLAMARALDYFGLRRISYVACSLLVCANSLKALCLADNQYIPGFLQAYKYAMLLLSEALLGFAGAIAFCIPPKVANVWFAHYESTLAMVIAGCGYNVGIGFSNYFTPIFVQKPDDMYKLSNMFLISAMFLTFVVTTFITRSSPKMPPSSGAMITGSSSVPIKNGLIVMFSNPSYLLLVLVFSFNTSLNGVEQVLLEEILENQHYTDPFCGTLIAQAFFFGTFFTLIGAAWVDNSANYVKVSRIASIIFALGFATFNVSIILPNIKNVILVTNVLNSFGASLLTPALLQVAIRSAVTILPEATVAATVIILQQLIGGALMNLIDPLRTLSPTEGGYQAPMLILSCLIVLINLIYVTSFRPPSRDELQQKLRADLQNIVTEENV